MRDLYNSIEVRRGESPIASAQTDDTAIVSEIIDMRGFKSMVWAVATGNLADSDVTTTILMEDGDDSGLSDNVAVADEFMLPDTAEDIMEFDFADDDQVRKMGYIGEKRYVRLTITPGSNASAFPVVIIAIMGDADQRPTTTQAT